MKDYSALVKKAIEMCSEAYAPYSKYRVGAAILTLGGKVYTGCNIENSSYSLCCCAERVALFKAVSNGEREFSAIAVAAFDENGESKSYCVPCGACRQTLGEFCGGDFTVICVKNKEDYKAYTLAELMPHGFSASVMNK